MAVTPKFISPYLPKTNLHYMALTVLLCSIFYLFGVWQHGSGSPPPTITHVHCSPSSSINNDTQHQKSTDFELDFSNKHAAELQISILPKYSFPPCDVKYSEYTPCEDPQRSLKYNRDKLIYRERHCPEKQELLKCRVPAPYGYKNPFPWPESRDYAWVANVPHKHLTIEKADQNWIKYEKDRFRFPGGGTMFPKGAGAYIDDIARLINLQDGSIRTAIDTGCGVASWGAYLLSRNILAMSFAPKDSHEAQVQFALERGVPALVGVIASKRLPYPSRAFDMAHCSRCLIPWGQYDGQYLIEVDRILRPGGYWILSGPPINWKNRYRGWNRTQEDLNSEQTSIESVARSLCWKKLKEKNDIAIWQKPTNHMHCKINRKVWKNPKFCQEQDPDQAWYTNLETCLTPMPDVSDIREIAGGKLANWPERLTATPPRILSGTIEEITEDMFKEDTALWKRRLAYYKSVSAHLGEKGRYRNVLDMNAHLGGFAAALVDDPLWVMNVVPSEASPIHTHRSCSMISKPLPPKPSTYTGDMRLETNQKPNTTITIASVLSVCAGSSSLKDGREVHCLVFQTGFNLDEYTCSALVDMYAKYGDVKSSVQVFNEMEYRKDVISWNSMIVGFSKNGYAEDSLRMIYEMRQTSVKPDDIMFLGVLTACSHAGLVSQGLEIFNSMIDSHGIHPRVDHYACMLITNL